MAAFDWINRLFQGGEQTRGLSGAEASAVALDDVNSFYNFRLRRHYTDDELQDDVSRFWFTNDDPSSRTGLGPHLAEVISEGQRFTDVLVVVSGHDWDAADDPDAWSRRIAEHLASSFEELLASRGIAAPSRRLGVWVVRDGAAEIGATEFGLFEGEFITGLVPNLYRKPGAASRALLALHVNLPGVWEGYREVGRLYDDQVLLTLGNHWLDNVQHPSLREAALYRLQRDDDGSFFHIINPDLQDRYQMTSTDQDGTSVITLATRDGHPLAYLVLAVLDDILPLPDHALEIDPTGEVELPDIAPPMILEEEPLNVELGSGGRLGAKTIIPDAQRERIFTLQERGALLQKVHFSAFMLGYDVYVGPRGELGTAVGAPAATFQVRKRTVSILANQDGVRVDGEVLPSGESRLIEGDALIEIGSQRLEYVELRGVEVEGWPYVGEIRRPATSTYMLWGREYTIGRSRECRVVLPDEPQNDNIVWKPKVGDGATIRSKTGEIPKSRFYTDSIMVASEHAAVELVDDVPRLACRARHCYGFLRRRGEVLALYPTTSGKLPQVLPIEPGDEILIGNCLFHASFTPVGEAVTPVAGPAPVLRAAPVEPEPVDELDAPLPASLQHRDLADADPDELFANLPDADDELEPPELPQVVRAAEAPAPAVVEEVEDELDDVPETFQIFADSPILPPPRREASAEEAPERPAAPQAAAEGAADAPPAVAVAVAGTVLEVDDRDVQFQLGRPARLRLVGWAINGTVTCGNHTGADLGIPESRISADQTFAATTYFELRVRGRRSHLAVLDPGELRVAGKAPEATYDDLDGKRLEVLRRDDTGEVDFAVELELVEDRGLPDPRARLLRISHDEPLAEALFTSGIPLRAQHEVDLNGLRARVEFDGQRLTLRDYLEAYRSGSGFNPFFIQHGGERFRTAPEDGSDLVLASGDRLVFGAAVYEFLVS